MDCIFCKIAKHKIKAFIVYEDEEVISFLDNDPINEGHVLIIPKKHYLDADDIPIDLLLHITKISQQIIKSLKKIYKAEGYSIMQNGGVFNDIGHYHMHIFQRNKNDGFNWVYSNESKKISEEIATRIRKEIKLY